MTDLYYEPPKRKRVAYTLVLICFFAGCIALLLSAQGIGPAALWQAIVLATSAAAVFVCVRYLLTSRSYRLTYLSGRRVLLVEETQGKRISCAFYLYLDRVEHLFYEQKDDSGRLLLHTPPKEFAFVKHFRYGNGIGEGDRAVIYASHDLGCVRVHLDCSRDFFLSLEQSVAQAKIDVATRGAYGDEDEA